MEWYDYITLAAIVLIIGVPRFIFLKRLRHKRSTDRSKYNSSSYKKTTNAISALGAIVDEAKASREAQERETGEKQFNENLTLVLLAIAAGIGYLQWRTLDKTDQTLKSQQRAWIAPVPSGPIIFDKPPEKTKPISVSIQIQNIGTAPAFDAVHHFELFRFSPQESATRKVIEGFGENTACDGLATVEGGHTIFPSATAFEKTHVFPADIWTSPIYDDPVQSMKDMFGIRGCVRYNTTIADRTTRFCFYLANPTDPTTPLNSWVWYVCEGKSQNFAD